MGSSLEHFEGMGASAIIFLVSFLLLDAKITRCRKEMRKLPKPISSKYASFVAHGSHSLTLNEIRFYFNAKAKVENGIWVVNDNLTAEYLLPNAPLVTSDSRFSSPSLFAFDKVLSHMDDKNYYISKWNTLQRVYHSLHMQESWQETAEALRKLPNKRKMKRVCKCLKDKYSSDIKDELTRFAKHIRAENSYFLYLPFWKLPSSEQQLNMTMTIVEDEESWKEFKDQTMVQYSEELKQQIAYNFAVYLKCML